MLGLLVPPASRAGPVLLVPKGPREGPTPRARGASLEWMGFQAALATLGLLELPACLGQRGHLAPEGKRENLGLEAQKESRESQDE